MDLTRYKTFYMINRVCSWDSLRNNANMSLVDFSKRDDPVGFIPVFVTREDAEAFAKLFEKTDGKIPTVSKLNSDDTK